MTDWGLMPKDVFTRLRLSFWTNRPIFKALLKGERNFPIVFNLKPPSGKQARDNLAHLQAWKNAWGTFHQPDCVVYETREFKEISTQRLPSKIKLPDIQCLAACLGESEEKELHHLQQKIRKVVAQPFVSDNTKEVLFYCLVDFLDVLIGFTPLELDHLCELIPQLSKGMGQGQYLRALPVIGVDTKFIESNLSFIEAILTIILDEAVTPLPQWLDCQTNPKGWLMVRPLCENTQAKLAGLPLLQMDTQTLKHYPLPAQHILVVENAQSGFGLPSLPDTIAVFSGGKNIDWLSADWLNTKSVAYFGDLDTEGLAILADARAKHSAIEPLMMDHSTLVRYENRMVKAPSFNKKTPVNFTESELALFERLQHNTEGKNRLEQERLPPDYIEDKLLNWIKFI